MHGKKREAVILSLIEKMHEAGSWTAETHVQKCCYFLQEALGVPLEFDFILYKHGPFAFDLREELEQMVSDLAVVYRSQDPYGPSLRPGETAQQLSAKFPKTIARYSPQVTFVAKRLAPHDVSWLERAGTALYVLREDERAPEPAARVQELKPHISLDRARAAVSVVEEILQEAEDIKASS